MPTIFKCKTGDAYIIKILAELLQNTIKTACFNISKEGINLTMMDHHKTILTKVDLSCESFILYRYKHNEPNMFIGINLSHFHKLLKSIKKKDSLQLFMNSEHPLELGIRVIPRENNRISTSFVKIQSIQNLDIDIPEGYTRSIIVPSTEYQKMTKDMAHIGSTITVTSRGARMKFACDAGNILKRHVEFGDFDDSSDEEDESTEDYSQTFETEQLCRITKLSGLCQDIQVYPKKGLPLFFRAQVGSLGYISIYIKSLEQIETDKLPVKEPSYEKDPWGV